MFSVLYELQFESAGRMTGTSGRETDTGTEMAEALWLK